MPLPFNKISKIHISDFKFFDKNRVIDLEGKDHLLLYGENGSGKSSINWALYTLLDSSIKDNQGQIEKYFKKGGKDNLVNIYAKNNSHSYVKLELDNGTEYQISPINYDILNNSTINGEAQAINLASDFINYRMLYKFHDLKHSKDFEVFDFLRTEVFMYLTIPSLSNQRADKIWKEIKNGPDKDFDLTGTEVYPIPSDITENNLALVGLKNKYKSYKSTLSKFNVWLKGLLSIVQKTTNNYLISDFKQPFEIKINYKLSQPDYDRTDPKIYDPEIKIEIPTYNGIKRKVIKPHTFLNEARLTSLAVAFRLSILKERAFTSNIRFLVLDDILISLDMSNRESILDIVLNKLSHDYQLIFLTHDKSLNAFVKLKINEWSDKNLWEFKEMYAGFSNIPVILEEYLDAISKAENYKDAYDYYSSGNNIRKAIEEELKELLPKTIQIITKDLNDELNWLFKYYDECKVGHLIPEATRVQLLNYKDIVFNPASHFDLKSPIYLSELNKAFDIHKTLGKIPNIKRTLLAGIGSSLFYTNTGNNYEAEYILLENLCLIETDGNIPVITDPIHKCIQYTENGILFLDKETGISKTADKIKNVANVKINFTDRCNRIKKYLGLENLPTLQEFTFSDNKTLQTKIDELNVEANQ